MRVEFIGAAQSVTGSKHLVHTPRARVLLDCGLFQGRRRESLERNRHLGVDPRHLSAVVLSHAHIDHSGALPLLVKSGYTGPIFTTPATRDLCAAMLEDTALVQASDARYINKVIARDGADMDPVEPLYSVADVVKTLRQIISVPYHRPYIIADGVTLTFNDAGHVLGSAIVVLDVDDVDDDGERAPKRLVYTGDLGRSGMPILRDPEVPSGADALICESTYGDRMHKPIASMSAELADVLARVYARGGKVVIPSFALERAQEIVFAMKALARQGKLPPMPVYVDSPLTVRISDVFRLHPECYDEETSALVASDASPFDFDSLQYVSDVEASKAIDSSDHPCVIISASGMCEGGRVLHHLKAMVESERNAVVIVGYQAQHTLGRRIVERRPRVRIFGVERQLRAEVVTLDGFSAHADQGDLLRFVARVRESGRLRHVALVHGEPEAQRALVAVLEAGGVRGISIPAPGDVLEL